MLHLSGKDGGILRYSLTYIDDVPVASNSDSLINWLGGALKSRFRKVTDEPLRWFLANRVSTYVSDAKTRCNQRQ